MANEESGDERCVVCGGPMRFQASAMADGFSLHACEQCGTRTTFPLLSDDEVGAFYPPSYYGEKNERFVKVLEQIVRKLGQGRARDVARRVPPGPVLDVGCGRGLTLAALRERGFEPHGVEVSDVAARHAREILGLDVRTDLFDPSFQPETFQAVIFWHSLEHLRDADKALRHAVELLKPGGLLIVAVPNSESLQARIFGEKWFHLDVPRHYHHFGLTGLKRMFSDNHVHVDEVRHLNLEQNPYGFLQSFMNKLGFDENFLYSMLKTPSARAHNLREHPVQAALTAVVAPPAAAASFGLALAEAVLGKGGTVEVYGTKEPAR